MPMLDLLIVGEAFEDIIFAGLPRLPNLGEELRTPSLVRTIGGGVVITSVSAARLGLRCGVISGLSEPATKYLASERIAVTNLRRPGELHATSVALSTERDRCFVTYNGVNDFVEERLLRLLAKTPRTRHLHWALTPKRFRPWISLLRRLRARGITTSWDFGWSDALAKEPLLRELIAELDVLFVNEVEAPLYSGKPTVEEAAAYLRERVPLTILKVGSKGARWLSSDRDVSAAPPKVKVVDTTGAGDAFNGGFFKGWLNGLSPERCLALGNRMGALSTRKAGGIDGLPKRSGIK